MIWLPLGLNPEWDFLDFLWGDSALFVFSILNWIRMGWRIINGFTKCKAMFAPERESLSFKFQGWEFFGEKEVDWMGAMIKQEREGPLSTVFLILKRGNGKRCQNFHLTLCLSTMSAIVLGRLLSKSLLKCYIPNRRWNIRTNISFRSNIYLALYFRSISIVRSNTRRSNENQEMVTFGLKVRWYTEHFWAC